MVWGPSRLTSKPVYVCVNDQWYTVPDSRAGPMKGVGMEWLAEQPAVLLALVAGLFTWGLTAAGAGTVLFVRSVSQRLLAAMLGMAAGVMLAASFWSLLAPSIELAEAEGSVSWVPALVGFLAGGVLIRGIDLVLPHFHPGRGIVEGPRTSWRRVTLLVTAITLHNVPEGLAVGVAFGAASAAGGDPALLGSAVALAMGIGLQNFPEGAAVAIPLRMEGFTRGRAFWYGQLSGAVEPVAAVAGAAMVLAVRPVLPYALSFAAGAMVFVVIEELIPESQAEVAHHDVATMASMAGFALMMTLDVALG